jgi:hypothetical protein
MSAADLVRTAPALPCPPTARHVLDAGRWRAMAAASDLDLIALWADAGQIVALLRDAAAAPLLATVAVESGFYPALSLYHPAAAPFERLVRDLWGYSPAGAIDDRALLDFGHWPLSAPLARPGPPIGSPEPPRGGLAHKGTLALMRGKSPRAAARFAARIDGMATVAHAIAFAAAAEAAAALVPPPRALALRELMARLERIAFALDRLAALATAAGAALPAALAARRRETVARVAAESFGHRLMMDCVVPGGVALDIDANGPAAILQLARDLGSNDLASACAALLAPRLADVPEIADGATALRDNLAAEIAGLALQVAELPGGALLLGMAVGDGEGLGLAEGPRGPVWHWLRLAGGQIAGAFVVDAGWALQAPFAARLAGLAAEDAAIGQALFALPPSGIEL